MKYAQTTPSVDGVFSFFPFVSKFKINVNATAAKYFVECGGFSLIFTLYKLLDLEFSA
jgi:hypothetical protein